MKPLARLLFTTLLLSLAACGGGGGGSSSPPAQDGGGGSGDDTSGGDQPGDGGHRVSGSVFAKRFSDTDADSNDPAAPSESNDTPDDAQPLGNPVVLGGFASVEEDPDDWYRLSLPESQSIRLTVHAQKLLPPQNDLDLYLYDAADPANPLESSTLGVDGTESIEVSESGDYLLRVKAESGASGYTLQIDSSYGRISRLPSVGDDFIPGELIVKRKVTAGNYQLQRSSGSAKGPYRHRLSAPDGLEPVRRSHPGADARTQDKLRTLMELKALRADPAVEYAEPNYRYHTLGEPNDAGYILHQWHYRNIHLPEAWETTTGSPDVIVAVLDTGIFSTHPDFDGKLLPGYDFISDPDNARDGDGMDSDPEDEGDLAHGDGSSWHGTHVAGTVGALTNNTDGVAGAGWQTRVMPLRVLGQAGGSSYDIAQAVRYAAGLDNDSGQVPVQKADVINMSFGGPGLSQTLQDAISAARDAGVILVAAAGNDNSSAPAYPAAMQGVIAVSATDANDRKAPYSNFGDWIDLAAPGGDKSGGTGGGVYSTYVDESGGGKTAGYASLQGTSMASPHAAGVFALMRAVEPGLTPDDLDALLANGQLTGDKGDPGRDPVYGHGLVDADKSVQAAQQGAAEPVIAADPETLNFGEVHEVLDVEIRNIGADGASISGDPAAGAAWITSVEALEVDHNGFGSYRVGVNRSGLSDGSYSSEVVFTVSGADDFRLPVNIHVGAGSSGYYAGYLYIQLLKPVDGSDYEVVQQLARSADGGEYPFEFTGVEPGDYAIAAGSDVNGNGTICEAGEACGLYPADGDKSFAVDGDRQHLDFVAGYSNE